MGAGDDDPIAVEERAQRLSASVERACAALYTAVLSHPSNVALRDQRSSGELSESELFSRVWQSVATAVIFAWTDARKGVVFAPPNWSDFLLRVRRAHDGASRGELAAIEGVFVSRSLVDELCLWAVSDESATAVWSALELEGEGDLARVWRSIDAVELVSALDDVLVRRLRSRGDSWASWGESATQSAPVVSRSTREFAAKMAIERVALELELAGEAAPLDGFVVFDPRCGCGAMLVAAARALSRRAQVDATSAGDPLAAVIASGVRGADEDPSRVALARLALWLDAPTLDAASLERCVVVRDREKIFSINAFVEGAVGRRCLALTDASPDAAEAIEDATLLLRDGDWLCALVPTSLAWAAELDSLRLRVANSFELAPVLIEPAIDRAPNAKKPAAPRLVLFARRVFGRVVNWTPRWRTAFASANDDERELFERLQRFGCCDDQLGRGLQLRRPNALAPNAVCLWRSDGRLLVAGSVAASDPEAVIIWATPGSSANQAMVAWFSASVVRWQFATSTRLRGRVCARLEVEEALELVSPTLARLERWDELVVLGAEIERRGLSRSLLARVDAIALRSLSLDPTELRALSAWQRELIASLPDRPDDPPKPRAAAKARTVFAPAPPPLERIPDPLTPATSRSMHEASSRAAPEDQGASFRIPDPLTPATSRSMHEASSRAAPEDQGCDVEPPPIAVEVPSKAEVVAPPPPPIVAPSAGRDVILSTVVGSSQRGPRAPSAGHAGASQGRGSEGALRARATDGRAAAIPSKRRVDQPEDEAEREAFALAVAAGSEGMPLDELVRRGREHTDEELREAVDSLVTNGWVVVTEDERPRVISARSSKAKLL